MNFGLDTLGLAKFDSAAIRAIPEGIAISAFAKAFGDAEKNVRLVCKTRKPTVVKIQMLWSDSHEYGDGDIGDLKAIARTYERVAKDFPKIKFLLSPFCEHKLSNPDKYCDLVAVAAPSCRVINTPWTGSLSRKYQNEVHGSHAAPRGTYFYSHDGTNSVDANVQSDKRKYGKAVIFWFWHPAFNGKLNAADSTPREQRESFPTADLIKSVWYLRREKGKCKLPKNHLWKSHADRHSTPPEPRAYKPVCIIPQQAPEIQLVQGKKVISRLKYYGPFVDGRHRYYGDSFGYEMSVKAGHKPCDLKVNGKVIGQLNPAFREGDYRE